MQSFKYIETPWHGYVEIDTKTFFSFAPPSLVCGPCNFITCDREKIYLEEDFAFSDFEKDWMLPLETHEVYSDNRDFLFNTQNFELTPYCLYIYEHTNYEGEMPTAEVINRMCFNQWLQSDRPILSYNEEKLFDKLTTDKTIHLT